MNAPSKTPSWTMRALAVWACAALFYGYQYVLRVSPGGLTDELARDFSVQGCALGILAAWYYNAYACLQVPVGLALDRLGTRKLVSISILLCAAGCAVFASAQSVPAACVARLLMGMGSACAFIGSIKLITLWFPRQLVARMVGFTMTIGTVGATLGVTVLPMYFKSIGWRESMVLLSWIGAALALFAWFVMKPRQNGLEEAGTRASKVEEEGYEKPLLEGLKRVAKTPQVWYLAFFGCLMYVPVAVFTDLWGVPFLTRLYHMDSVQTGAYLSALPWGIAVGGMAFSALSDRIKRRLPLMRLGAFVSVVCYGIIILVPVPAPLMGLLLIVAGFSFGGQLLCFTAVTESLPLWASGVAVGFTNMVIMTSGVLFQPLVGKLLDVFWDGVPGVDGAMFSVEAFRWAFTPVVLGLGGAFLLTFVIKETHPERQKICPAGDVSPQAA